MSLKINVLETSGIFKFYVVKSGQIIICKRNLKYVGNKLYFHNNNNQTHKSFDAVVSYNDQFVDQRTYTIDKRNRIILCFDDTVDLQKSGQDNGKVL